MEVNLFLAAEATISILVKVRTALISAFAVQVWHESEFCRSRHAFIQLHLEYAPFSKTPLNYGTHWHLVPKDQETTEPTQHGARLSSVQLRQNDSNDSNPW